MTSSLRMSARPGLATPGRAAGDTAVPSVTNRRLVRGRGRFLDDIRMAGTCHVAIVRSPHAHARVLGVDTTAARGSSGVVDVVTYEDVWRDTNPIPEGWDTSTVGARRVDWYALTGQRVRFVGEAVAAVVAETPFEARAAADRVEVAYEPIVAVVDAAAALADGAPLVEPSWDDNVLVTRDYRHGDVDRAFAEAHRVVRGEVASQRITGVPLEPRGILASYDANEDVLTFWESTQQPHPVRTYLAEALGVAEGSIRVRQPHVGGAFGLKQPTSQEEVLLAYLARRLRRPVKWVERRHESLQVGGHSRETTCSYAAAVAENGTLAGLRVDILADVGAPTAFLGWGMSMVTMFTLPSVYRVPSIDVRLRTVVTNKCPWTPYRGFGKDVATFVMERVLDHVAGPFLQDRVAVRLSNVLEPAELPLRRPSGAVLDSGDYPAALRDVLDAVDLDGFRERQREARAQGRRLGLGIGYELTPEGVAIAGSLMNNAYDGATVRISPTGEVTVLAGVTTPGTGNETALGQIAARTLGCARDRVTVVQGDTQVCPWGLGNFSSRSIIIGGSAVHLAATELREKLRSVAASMIGVEAERVESTQEERFHAIDDPTRSVGFEDVVRRIYWHAFEAHADVVEPALEVTRYYRIGNIDHHPSDGGRPNVYPTFPYGAVACVVDVDEATGFVRVLRYCAVEDAGHIINPLLADAQLHGGIAQGLGSTLYESLAHDDAGQPLASTLMDYTIPTAVELPAFEIHHRETPSPFTPLGAKGVGESGLGGTLGAVCSAVENAFPELDLRFERLPLSPSRVWHTIREARQAGARA